MVLVKTIASSEEHSRFLIMIPKKNLNNLLVWLLYAIKLAYYIET